MKKLAVVAVNMWLSYLFGSLLVMAFIGAAEPVHAAEFFCPSGDVSCLIAAKNGKSKTVRKIRSPPIRFAYAKWRIDTNGIWR